MNEVIAAYISGLEHEFKTGQATEHTYRSHLKELIEGIDEKISAVNEPKRQNCGAPDYILMRKEVPVGFIEAKDIGIKLDTVEKSDQMDRYLDSLENLILTDYLEFRFYKNGEKTESIRLAELKGSIIEINHEEVDKLVRLLQEFVSYDGQTIKSASKLAKSMAGKARLMKDVIVKTLADDDKGGSLRGEFDAFKQILIHDMTEEQFADMYAQTIAYGLFAARLHDVTLETFSRQEAAELLPKTNPFLRKLFHTIAGPGLDTRIVWIVDALADVFRATDIKKILESFSKESKKKDPFIHFYETFLSEYDPALRKSRGVWYTPEPVVQFIVRAVDDILKSDFDLPLGLADTSMTNVEVEVGMEDARYKDGKKKIEKQVHRVQILDPATGTGTFLAEVIRKIHENFEGQAGIWDAYVNEHLLPRIHGFELLMASYAMCHLKIDLLLNELGYKQKDVKNPERLSVYLTNSLEEAQKDDGTFFGFNQWLTQEGRAANIVKRDSPIMVVIGNPPYSVSSSNKSEWILGLLKDYKKDLKERKINLDDDYIKFIRYGQHFIDKNGTGILAYISNNSFLDGVTHRQMRKSLLQTFDDIYIIDLHGNSKKKEQGIDGGKDENVFNIMQGVSINIFVKSKKSEGLGRVHHFDMHGLKKDKYKLLADSNMNGINWADLNLKEPYHFFVPKDFSLEEDYNKGFSLPELFQIYSSGIETQKDSLVIQMSENDLAEAENAIINDETLIREKYKVKDSRDWKLALARKDLQSADKTLILYRPFDTRFTFYSGKSKGIMAYPRNDVMQHFMGEKNIGLLVCKRQTSFDFQHVFITNKITERCGVSLQTGEVGYVMPLFVKSEDGLISNLSPEILKQIFHIVGEVSDENVFDYLYAVLHSPSYREKYKEFLKIDFPRVPYPKDKKQFKKFVTLGGELRKWHLMEHSGSDKLITAFPESGSNLVEKGYPKFEDGKVHINSEQYFDNVSESIWNFYIGGYQPAQKWLKDRRGRSLSFDDIVHWQKIIVALSNTERIMGEIDEIWQN